MGVKAQWFVPDLASGGDPFDDDEEPIDVTSAGVRIDLRDDPDTLFARLSELLDAESRLYNAGRTCQIKDMADTCCHACPYQGVKGELCHVGLEQEQVLTRMAAAEKVHARAR